MKLKPFETVLVDATVNTKFCVSWSDDYKISVLAEDGVHIYELDPFASEVFLNAIKYSWIPNNTAFNFLDTILNSRINNFLWKLNRSQLCDFVTDSIMPTSLKTCSGVKSRTIQSLFSPLICGKSCISCLSENGCLDIYEMNLNKWVPVINVTEEWIKYCMFQTEPESDLDLNNLKLRISSLKIVTHAWFKDPEVADVYLVTGHEDGGIVIWNVHTNKDISVKTHFQVFETPSALAMESLPDSSTSAVFVGVASGRILTFSLKEVVSAESDLWKERDSIAASRIKPYLVKSYLYVVSVKHHVILLHVLPKNFVHVLKTKWFEFPAPVVGLQNFKELVVVALQNQEFQTLELSDGGQAASFLGTGLSDCLRAEKEETDCYGLAISKNSALWITVSTKVSCTDKPARGPTRLQIYANRPVSYKSLSDPSGSGLVAKISSSDIKLTEILDLLEIKKSEFLGEQTLSYLEEGDLTLLQLKLLLWEVKLKTSSCPHSTDFEAAEDRLKRRIVTKYAREKINGSLRTDQSREVDPSTLSAFLEQEKNGNKSDVNFVECTVCKESLVLENFKTCSCSNLHRFPRCNISLLPCTQTPYAFCRRCNAVALEEYVSEEGSHCLFCDGLLIHDSRLRPKITRGPTGNIKGNN